MPLSLTQIYADAQSRAKSAPMDLSVRSTLWQVLVLRGEPGRARAQLDMMLKLDASWAMEVQGCHALLDAEDRRGDVFAGREPPTCLGQPPSWFGTLVSALPLLAQRRSDAAAALLERVSEQAEPCTGVLNGVPFEWICDGDARLSPCLEVVAQGKYIWVPFGRIRRLTCEAPGELRDLMWLPAKLEVDESGALDVFLPARYPGAEIDEHRLGRRTDWQALSDKAYVGAGQKCLGTDADLTGLLDVRELRIGA